KNSPGMGVMSNQYTSYNEFINLKVHHNGGTTPLNHGFYIEGDNILIEHCDIHHNAGFGISNYNEYGTQANNNVYRYNNIHENSTSGGWRAGIGLTQGAGNKAYNNIIWGNSGGIEIDYSSIGSQVYNNTIFNNSLGGEKYGISIGAGSGAIIQNNIVYQNPGGNIIGSQTGMIVSNNLTSDPLFVNSAGLNFHLTSGSPAIDKGLTISAVFDDYDGVLRPKGAAYDIGAFEYGGVAPLPSVDVTAPVISGVAASAVGQTGATIGWTTNEAADTQVEYGATTAYGASTVLNSTLSTSHGAVLSGLTAGTLYHYRVKSKDAAGNLAASPDATFTTAAPTAIVLAAGCASSAGAWANAALPSQTGAFTAEFDAVPGTANMDGVSGLSNASASAFGNLAAAVRFNNAGLIDARNGGAYAAAAPIPYVSGLTYHFRLVINVPAHTYSAYVKQGANAEQLIGSGYAFRTEQAAVTTLNNVGLVAGPGSLSVCGAAATASGAAADTAAPVISAVAASAVSQTGATIGWTTNEAADTQVEYGPTTAYGASTVLNSTLSTSHGAALSGLTAGTLYHYRVKSKDAAGNLAASADATFTTAAPTAIVLAAGCVNSAGTWVNAALPSQTGTFTAEFDAVPGMTNMDGVSGLSNGAAADYNGLAAAVRFNNAGTIDARNGGAFGAAAAIPYVSGLTYHFRLAVSVPAHTYSAYVKQGANAEQLIGAGYAFRTEQAAVAALSNLGLFAGTGSLSVCGAAVTASGVTADIAPPVISGVAASAVGQTGATIGWTTNELADTQVEYGATTAYGASTVLSSTLSTSHGAVLSGLTAGTLYHYRVKSKDAAGNLAASPDATFTTAAAVIAAACVNSAGTWVNAALPSQTGTFGVEFDAAPGMKNMDGVIGLSNGAAAAYTSLAAAVRFNNAGTIDARNGGAFAAVAAIPYIAGLTYHFRLAVSVPAHAYSAYVKQGANAEQLIGGSYAFRIEQNTATALNNLGLFSATGSEQVCGAAVK
ncbi:MAG: fibronectin type III domain-containing protein, partial [Elusimicrobia bacterium]|nr:fibronectin type III domain-containing protein [Elusimicrobiota bacterium]